MRQVLSDLLERGDRFEKRGEEDRSVRGRAERIGIAIEERERINCKEGGNGTGGVRKE